MNTAVRKNASSGFEHLEAGVHNWFQTERLLEELNRTGSETEQVAAEWLGKAGKRWRPLLTAGVYAAISGQSPFVNDAVRKAAISVECFHKASLIHDDIEDDDDFRYDTPTLHHDYGVPFALNVGDFLLGEGYRLAAGTDCPARDRIRLMDGAIRCHRELSIGQGDELSWTRAPGPLSVDQVLSIFNKKTAPAFEFALIIGAIIAGADDALCDELRQFGKHFGAAYQVQDDIDDFNSETDDDIDSMRPSVLVALAYEAADPAMKRHMDEAWRAGSSFDELSEDIRSTITEKDLVAVAGRIHSTQRDLAHACVAGFCGRRLRTLLFSLLHVLD